MGPDSSGVLLRTRETAYRLVGGGPGQSYGIGLAPVKSCQPVNSLAAREEDSLCSRSRGAVARGLRPAIRRQSLGTLAILKPIDNAIGKDRERVTGP